MPYVLSLVLLVVGLLVLLGVVLATYRAVRRVRSVQEAVSHDVADRVGLLQARTAGIRVALSQRSGRTIE